jgi:hypothetical protein
LSRRMWPLSAGIRSPTAVTDCSRAARNATSHAGLTDADGSSACERSYWSKYSCAYVRAS